MNRQLYSAAAILLLAMAPKCSMEQKMNFEKLEYFNAELEEAPQTLTISAAGVAFYESHTNAHQPDRPEIGNYQTSLGEAELGSLRNRLDNPPFRDLADHWGKVMPSDRYKRIRVTTGSESLEKLFGTSVHITAPAAELIDYLNQLAAEVSRSPRQTLRSELSQVAVSSERLLTATLTLFNDGGQPTFCRHPVDMLDAPDGHLKMEAWPDKPAGSLSAEDVMIFPVEKVVKPESKAGHTNSSILEIPSKASQSLRLEAQFPKASAGAYVIRINYESLVKQLEGRQLVYGELFSRTIKANAP